MEKNHRLFLRNLPADIEKSDLEKLFENHGTITNIDIKDKIQNDGSKIAFVNVSITDVKLNACFRAINGTVLRENAIRVEVAKESYLDRLKREREEAAAAIKTPVEERVLKDRPIERINIKMPEIVKTKSKKRIYNFDDADNEESMNYRDEKSNNTSDFSYDPALHLEDIPCKKQLKTESPLSEKINERIEKVAEKKVLSESEIKRLASLKQKKQTFKANEKLISQALKAVDTKIRNNKVIFPEDIDKIIESPEKRNKALFDDDGDTDDEKDWNDVKFEHDEKRNTKLKMSLNNLGRDKRFLLDERFIDDDKKLESKTNEEKNESSLKNETEWQLNILENVLGKPFKVRDDNIVEKKQNKMIRYDPTSSNHEEHELKIKKPVTKAKKVKLTSVSVEEETPIAVSSDVFYAVSENLTEALKPQEEFSLLKSFGTATAADKNNTAAYEAIANAAQGKKWENNYDAKNPFKYESSDDETSHPSMTALTNKNELSTKSNIRESNYTFFFATNDGRFHEAEEFFNKSPVTENFTNVRRELKQIVRSKIRNNVKKNTPWRNTKIGSRAKTH